MNATRTTAVVCPTTAAVVAVPAGRASFLGHKIPAVTSFKRPALYTFCMPRGLLAKLQGHGVVEGKTSGANCEVKISPIYNSYDSAGGIGSNAQALKFESPEDSLRRRHISWICSESKIPDALLGLSPSAMHPG